jgi:hypothetical protein
LNNDPWSSEELEQIQSPWEEFHKLYPERSYHAWRHKRADLRKGRTPTEKKAVVQDDQDNESQLSDDDLWNAAVAYQDAVNDAFPHSLFHHLSLSTKEPIAIAFPSDWHIGSDGTDLKRIKEDCELIANHPRVYCALGGDPIDNFIFAKMMSASRSQAEQVHVQWRLFRHRVQQLMASNSLLWVSSGNHDAWTVKASGIDGILSSLSGIPVCYTKEGGFIYLTVGKQQYVIYRKHRPTRFNSHYNPLHFLKQMLRMGTPIEFDIGISEHFHQADLEVCEYRPGSKMDRVLIACGSYKEKDLYAEEIGYYGGGYGVPTVILYPDRRKMLPFMSITDAIEALDGVSYRAA